MNVLVGGGSGFIGTALVKTLKQNGYVPRIISRRQLPNSLTWVRELILPNNFISLSEQCDLL